MLDAACQAHGGIGDPKNLQYMQELTVANRQYPQWKEINARINRIHDDQEKKIHGRGASKDPMEAAVP
jgi:hypothetical protein